MGSPESSINSYSWASGPGLLAYHAVITRDFPEWRATVTGGNIPEPGHVLTSLSYVRLQREVWDWVEWNGFGELNGWIRELRPVGHPTDGWSLGYHCRWPHEVSDALARYRAAAGTIDEASATMEEKIDALGEPLQTILGELRAGEADVADIVGLSPEEAEQIMAAYRDRERLLDSRLTLEDWRALRSRRGQSNAPD